MPREIPDKLLPVARECARRHLSDRYAQAMLLGPNHPEAKRLAAALADARELMRVLAEAA